LRFLVLQRGAWSAAAVAVDAGLDGAAVTGALFPAEGAELAEGEEGAELLAEGEEGAELAEGEAAADSGVLGGVIDVATPQPAIDPSNVNPAIRAAT
jgi:hypothetical protein